MTSLRNESPGMRNEGPGTKARHGLLGFVRRRPVLTGVLFLVLLGAGYFATRGGGEQAGAPIIAEATRSDVENVVTAVGNLQPLTFVDVGAQVSGQLQTIHVVAGDEVEKGHLLAEIDATVQGARVESDRAQLQNLRAQLADRQAQLKLATAQAERQERLKADNATSIEAYDSAQAALQSAEAQVRATQAQIQQSESTLRGNEATLGYSRIFAPIAGTVSSITAKQGQTLNANQQAPTILQIADLRVMTVSTQVSEADVQRLRIGMPAYFTTLGNPERRWPGNLRQVLPTPQVVNNVVMYTALFDVKNPDKELMTQMTAQVFFVLESAPDAIVIPVAAVRYTDRPARGGRGNNVPAPQAVAPPASADAPGRGEAPMAAENGGRRGNGAGSAGGAGGRRGEGRGAGGRGAAGRGAGPRIRPAVVTVVDEAGNQSERAITVGVTDRIRIQVVSGLEEGEQVVTGTETRNEGGNGGRGGGGGGFGGGFGGRGFGGAP